MTALAALRSALFYLVFYPASAVFVLGSALVALVSPAHVRPVPDAWSRFHRASLRIVGIRVRELGPRPAGPALYALKHESYFDAIDLPTLLDYPVPFAKQELYALPGWSRAALTYGSVPIARDQGARTLRTMLTEAKRFAATGRPLAIFPEGTRVPHGTIVPLQAGFAGIYKVLGLPVIPVAIDSGPLYHRWIKRPGTITVLFGDPIEPGLPRDEIEARVLAAINALNTRPPEA